MLALWATCIAELDKRGHMVKVNLHCQMMEKCVSETDNICTHLDDMALSYKHLSSMGVTIHDKDYASMVLMSLSDSYTNLKTLADTAISGGHTFTAHNFIAQAIERSTSGNCRPIMTPSWVRKLCIPINGVPQQIKEGKLLKKGGQMFQ